MGRVRRVKMIEPWAGSCPSVAADMSGTSRICSCSLEETEPPMGARAGVEEEEPWVRVLMVWRPSMVAISDAVRAAPTAPTTRASQLSSQASAPASPPQASLSCPRDW